MYNTLKVIWKYFYSTKSSSEHGTLYQIRNMIRRSSVVKKPKRNFNACEDFFITATHSLITASALEVLQMKNIDDIPSGVEEDVWLRSEKEREQLMYSLTSRIVDKMIVFEFNNEARRSIEEDGVLNYAKQLLSIG